MGFNWATEGNPIRAAAAGKGSFPGDEGTAKRFRPATGDDACRSILRAVPDRSSPSPDSRSRGPHHGRDASPSGIGQAVPDGGQFGHLGRDHLGFNDAARLLG